MKKLILFITFIIIEIISYYIMNFREIKGGKSIAIFLVVIIYLFFFYFTYYPPINDLFYDPSNKVYGIEDK